ncbi:MAG: plasmid stabilization system protein ParE [Verrucomicrobiales bacterium]|jgi:plasmid stabilization system protein ParE
MKRSNTSEFEKDVISALEWTLENFGSSATDRYAKLIDIALKGISIDPLLSGSSVFQDVRLYHLRHCRKSAPVAGIVVKNPRHFVAYRVNGDTIEILRLLHESMDFILHLGDDQD